MTFKYPLQIDPFSWLDKAKVGAFILAGNRLTQGDKVREYEAIWEKQTGAKYAVFVNSGSSANFLIALRLKDKLIKNGKWNKRKIIILPAITWATSVTPWTILGFKPYFIDIADHNWGLNYDLTKEYLDKNHTKVAAIFPTALLGMNFQDHLFRLKYPDVTLLFDGCEASFNKNTFKNDISIFSQATSTTSTFFAHYANSIEGGLIFCDNEEDYAWYLMARNHGLVRSLYPYIDRFENLEKTLDRYRNLDVGDQFDFNIEGMNLRNTEINAYFGILDSYKWDEMIEKRKTLASLWRIKLDREKYDVSDCLRTNGNVPFALPIVVKNLIDSKVEECLIKLGVEYRPIISGSLRYQKIFKKYMRGSYPVADHLHSHGIYIGLNTKLKESDIEKISFELNCI